MRRASETPRARRGSKNPALALVILLMIGSSLTGTAAGAPVPCPSARPNLGNWTTIPVGPWPSGGPNLVDYAVDPLDPDNMLATNGSSVVSSRDGGCTWARSIDLAAPDQDTLSVAARAAGIPYFTDNVGLLLVEDQLPAHHPALLLTQDGGDTWDDIAPSLAQVRGRPLSFAVGGGRYYLLVDRGEGQPGVATVSPPRRLYVSEDGGTTWNEGVEKPPGTTAQIGPIPPITIQGEGGGTLDALEAPLTKADELWLYGSAGLYRSENGGANASPMATPAGGTIGLTEAVTFNGPISVITAYSATQPIAARSYDDKPFVGFTPPTVVESASYPLVAGPEGVFVEYSLPDAAQPQYIDISPIDHRQIYDVSTAGLHAFGRTAVALERYDVGQMSDEDEEPIYVPPLGHFDPDNPKNPRLASPEHRIVLHPGESKKVDYSLFLPPTPTPLDVFFLIDTSSSMQGAINGTRAAMFDITESLSESGKDVWFGVGEYRSYTSDPAYDRVLDMTEPGPAVSNALNKLEAFQGGEETQLAALYQVATGAGQNDRTSSVDAYIPAGQQANFRPGSARVIIHTTDEEFSEGRPHPTYDKVADALNAKHIGQIGLNLVQPAPAFIVIDPGGGVGGGPSSDAGPGLRKIAAATETVAPAQGVDCDGDGLADLTFDQPLVCNIPHDRAEEAGVMGNAIINTIESLPDYGSIRLNVLGDGPVSTKVDPPTPIFVDFKEKQAHGYTVTYRCPHLETSKVVPLTVSASRPAGVLAQTHMTVVCKVPGEPVVRPEEKRPPPFVPFFAPLIPILPIPPRPPDIGPNPNPQPQPNPQAQGQGAFAAQEEQQHQLAYATGNTTGHEVAAAEQEGDKFAFSRFRQAPSQRPLDPLFILAAAAMTCAAGAALVRQRTQARTRPATNAIRRDRRKYGRRY